MDTQDANSFVNSTHASVTSKISAEKTKSLTKNMILLSNGSNLESKLLNEARENFPTVEMDAKTRFLCDICQLEFIGYRAFTHHNWDAHRRIQYHAYRKIKPYPCRYCGRGTGVVYPTRKDLCFHVMQHLTGGDVTYPEGACVPGIHDNNFDNKQTNETIEIAQGMSPSKKSVHSAPKQGSDMDETIQTNKDKSFQKLENSESIKNADVNSISSISTCILTLQESSEEIASTFKRKLDSNNEHSMEPSTKKSLAQDEFTIPKM